MFRKICYRFSQEIEEVMAKKLQEVLKATKVEVIDTSGGCNFIYYSRWVDVQNGSRIINVCW